MRTVFFLSVLLFGLTACENKITQIDQEIKQEWLNQEVATDVELIYSDSAIIRVLVKGDTMITQYVRKQAEQEFPNGIQVDFFDQLGRIQSVLTSKYAIRYESKKQIVVRDSVVWKSQKPEILETEELIWDEKEAKVFSKRFVKITTPEDIFYGYGFEADEEFSKWKIIAPMGEMQVDNFDVE